MMLIYSFHGITSIEWKTGHDKLSALGWAVDVDVDGLGVVASPKNPLPLSFPDKEKMGFD